MYRCNLTQKKMNPTVMDLGVTMVLTLTFSGMILHNDIVLDRFDILDSHTVSKDTITANNDTTATVLKLYFELQKALQELQKTVCQEFSSSKVQLGRYILINIVPYNCIFPDY